MTTRRNRRSDSSQSDHPGSPFSGLYGSLLIVLIVVSLSQAFGMAWTLMPFAIAAIVHWVLFLALFGLLVALPNAIAKKARVEDGRE